MVIPIMILGKVDMYGVFTEKREDRIWQKEEIKFLADAMKILQSILTRRIQKNSLAGSYACLETILDNVGGAVYVRDFETGNSLFTNRNMRGIFGEELKNGNINKLLEKTIVAEKGIGELFLEDPGSGYRRRKDKRYRELDSIKILKMYKVNEIIIPLLLQLLKTLF